MALKFYICSFSQDLFIKINNLTFNGKLEFSKNSTFIDPPDDVLRLGDIIISYPQVIERARDEEMLVDDKIDELIVHGLKNLMGI